VTYGIEFSFQELLKVDVDGDAPHMAHSGVWPIASIISSRQHSSFLEALIEEHLLLGGFCLSAYKRIQIEKDADREQSTAQAGKDHERNRTVT
jgi:hypothetical protein